MAKGGTFEYGIKFNVDKTSLNEINSYLSQIQKIGADKLTIKMNGADGIKQIEEIKKSATIVQEALQKAFNVRLNSANLLTFNKELQKAGINIETIYKQFSAIGIVGSTAFKNLTSELLTTNLELKESQTLLDKMATTMSNTVKWGISSAIFNKITGSIQSAYNYTLKLDKSLNAIRRVSNATADDMERFAKYANESAKAMGATTLDYTQGALIYYQQGLSESEVKKRTDVTIKMANALGTTSEEVSNYMTAIWNNFDNGSKSLEHYADVITKLGATTASSSEEIATGLEKFASVSKTVGLSYEYATAALATVVAQTRQSADTVGTSFKTLFSRIQGLKLGETLDDGTTLTKYSEALNKIGVNIKDASGNLKDMDVILDEMGAKWQTLTDAQKVATAQTVGGVRQYSQLIALMDNWDKFSENLQTAYHATGELQRQQDVYMDSAEAHLNKMQAAFEGLYDAIFDEDTIKDVSDIVTVLVDKLSVFIKTIGGGGNALMLLGTTALRVFDDQITRGLMSTIRNFQKANENADILKAKLELIKTLEGTGITEKDSNYNELLQNEKQMISYGDFVTPEQHNIGNAILRERAEIEKEQEAWEKDLEAASNYFSFINKSLSKQDIKDMNKDTEATAQYEQIENAQAKAELELKSIEAIRNIQNKRDTGASDFDLDAYTNKVDDFINKLQNMKIESPIEGFNEKLSSLLDEYTDADLANDTEKVEIVLQRIFNLYREHNEKLIEEGDKTAHTLGLQIEGYGEVFEQKINDNKSTWNDFIKSLETGKAIKSIINVASAFGQVASGISILTNLTDVWADKTISDGQKITRTLTSIGSALPMIIRGISTIIKLGQTNPWLLAITLTIGAIGGLIAILKSVKTEEEKLAAELEKTKKAVKDAQQAYEDLQNTINDYSSARESIDKLTEGTIDFYQAIIKSNEEAQKLIDTLNLVFGQDYTIGEDGVITIKNEALENALFEQTQDIYRKQAQEYAAQIKIVEKQQNDTIEKFRKEVNRLAIQQNGSTFAGELSFEQAKNLLDNSKSTNIWLGKIQNISSETKNAIEQTGKNTENAIKTSSVDFSTAIKTYLPTYEKNEASINAYRKQEIIDSLKGYGTREQVQEFNSQTMLSQDYIARILNKQLNATKRSAGIEDKSWFGNALDFGKDFLGSLFSWSTLTNPGLGVYNGISSAITNKNTREQREDALASLYLQSTKKYTRDKDNNWFDSQGNQISSDRLQKELNEVDLGTAIKAYENGQIYVPQEYKYSGIPKALEKIRTESENETSRRRISEMVLALSGGASSEELTNISKTLSNDEKQYLLNNISSISKLTVGNDYAITSEDKTKKSTYEGLGFSGTGLTLDNGMSLEEIQKYLELSKSEEETEERKAIKKQEYNDALEKQAALLGTTSDALDFFRIAAQKAGKVENDISIDTANAAAEQYKFNKNYNNAVSVYKKNEDAIKAYGKALKNGKEISYDLADAMGELKQSLKEMGLSLSGETISKNLNLINKLLNGTKKEAEEAYKKLYNLAREDILNKFFGNNEKYKSQFADIIKDIDSVDPGKTMSTKYSDQLRQMINDTKLTVDQINELANGLGITIPVEYNVPEKLTVEDKELTTKATSTLHRYTGQMPNPAYDPRTMSEEDKYIPVNYSWVETTEDKTDHFLVPSQTNFTVNTNKQNIGKNTNFAKSLGNSSSKKSGGSSKPKQVDKSKDEFDRYHKVNTQIEKIENSLKKVQSQQNKLVGGNLIKNLNKQWSLINTQINNYNEKLRIANGEQKELANKLIGKGVKFNNDGTVANYIESLQAAEDKYNKLVDKYNKLSKKQQEKWDKDKTLDKAKEEYEEFKKNIDRYDEVTVSLIPELEQSKLDAIDKQIEISVQKFDVELEITLNMNEATRNWNEWKKRIIDGIKEDDIYGNANARLQDFSTYYAANANGDIQARTKKVNAILEELKVMDEGGISSVYGDDRARALEALHTEYTALMESMTDAAEIEKELYQAILDEMDAIKETFDEQVANYQFLSDIINHDLKVVQMVYGEDAYGEMSKFYNKQQETYKSQLDFQRQEKEFWWNAREAAEEGTEEWEKANENWKQSVQDFNQTFEQGLENAKNEFQNAINDIFKTLNNEITNGKGLDFINEEWELINKNANKYLDTINKTYGIRELEKKYLDSINKTDNVKAQQNLKKLMDEQLNSLKQKDRLTQYDLDRANKLYEIELARMALEDTRNNKSQMRLRRDSQGNYTYQYVANEDEIQKAQDKVDELTNSLYNFDKDRYNSMLSEVYTLYTEYQQKMAEAALITDPELRAEKERLIQEQYNELMMQTEEDYQVAKYNLQESFFNDWVNLNNMTLEDFKLLSDNEKDIIMTELVPTWKNGLSEMADAFYGEKGFATKTEQSWKNIKLAENEYYQDLQEWQTIAGKTYEEIAAGLDEDIQKIGTVIENNDALIKKYDEELDKVKEVHEAVLGLIQTYKDAEDAAKDATTAAYNYEHREDEKQINEVQEENAKQPESEPETTSVEDSYSPVNESVTDNTLKTGTGDGKAAVGDEVTVKSSAKKWGSKSGGGYMWNKVPGNKFYIKDVSGNQVKIGDPHGPNYWDTGVTGWANLKDLTGYDTGGYTGTWNDSGKLAMLHQKELVLNQSDTKNMLDAVSIMRDLTYSLGSSVLSRLAGASANNYSGSAYDKGLLEQNVHIDATFPNVRNASEIEQALNNLVNVASQRIMEKR